MTAHHPNDRFDPDAVRDERPQPITTLDEVRAPFNVVAAVASLEDARHLIERLETDGVDADAISLLGAYPAEPGEEVAAASEDEPPTRIAKAAATGAAVGASAAAAAGFALPIPGLGPVITGGLWSVFGGAAGATYAAPSRMGVSQAWRHTFETVRDGNFAVGVHSGAKPTIEKAEEIMQDFSTLSVNRFED